jgi:DNA/RNA-binding domain of Phe-tRNA-synthetase-like protein
MKVLIAEETMTREPRLVIGYAVINDISVNKAEKPLKKEVLEVVNSVRDKYPSRIEMYVANAIKGMRDLFKRNGTDPSKYAPSAEALLKRIIDGKDLYRINNVVEGNNMGSMKFELPMGVYNMDNLTGDVVFQFGTNSEVMETMAKGGMNMENTLLTRDDEKPFGSPVSDSPRAMIAGNTKNVLLLVYGTSDVGEEYVAQATEYTAKKIIEHAGGSIGELEVISSE